ncbi:MAG: hypothetical protein ACFFD4_24270 [Candidatus Odinarchaeota archaeon]
MVSRGRDLVEWVSDHLLILHICKEIGDKQLHGRKMQMIAFMSEIKLWNNGLDGFDYHFIRMYRAPHSRELKIDCERLTVVSLLEYSTRTGFTLSKEGYKLLDQFSDIVRRNEPVFQAVSKVTNEVMNSNYDILLEKLNKLPNPSTPAITIDMTDEKEYLINRNTKGSLTPFDITEIEAESLEMVFDSRLHRTLLKADESVKNGPLIQWKS